MKSIQRLSVLIKQLERNANALPSLLQLKGLAPSGPGAFKPGKLTNMTVPLVHTTISYYHFQTRKLMLECIRDMFKDTELVNDLSNSTSVILPHHAIINET